MRLRGAGNSCWQHMWPIENRNSQRLAGSSPGAIPPSHLAPPRWSPDTSLHRLSAEEGGKMSKRRGAFALINRLGMTALGRRSKATGAGRGGARKKTPHPPRPSGTLSPRERGQIKACGRRPACQAKSRRYVTFTKPGPFDAAAFAAFKSKGTEYCFSIFSRKQGPEL